MNRLAATLKLDVTLQQRNQLYSITVGVAFLIVLLLWQFVPVEHLGTTIPLFFLFSLVIYYFFAGGILLLEKGQHVLSGLIVTPLRPQEYLASKALTLTLLALVECVLIVLLTYGYSVAWLPLLAGIAIMTIIYTLLGIAVVVRYQSITDFLMPSILFVTVTQLPAVGYSGLWENPIWYLFPLQGALLLLKAGFTPIAAWEMVYALLASLVWIGVCGVWSFRAFDTYIVQRGG